MEGGFIYVEHIQNCAVPRVTQATAGKAWLYVLAKFVGSFFSFSFSSLKEFLDITGLLG